MLRSLTEQAANTLIRTNLAMFHRLGDEIRLTEDDRRRALNLDDGTWTAWMNFLFHGPLPSHPPLPEMLLRLSEAAFHLSMVADLALTFA